MRAKTISTQRARALRKDMTDAERLLWHHLRDRRLGGFKFRRQHRVGRFIVDFLCAEEKIIIEVDGGQHAINAEADNQRSLALDAEGYQILRFWNHEVLQETAAVLSKIFESLSA